MRTIPVCSLPSALLLISLFTCFHANTQDFSHNNIEIGFSTNPGGIGGKGELQFHPHAHFHTSAYSQLKGDWFLSGGVGFSAPINPMVEFHGALSSYYTKGKDDDKHHLGKLGYGLEGGIRAMVIPKLELNYRVGRVMIDGEKTKTLSVLGVRFHSTKNISIGLNFHANGIYEDQYFMSVKYPF